MEYTSSFMGSLRGANHSGGTLTSLPKKTLDTTSTTSPKYPPNRMPHTMVETPHSMKSFSDLRIPALILGNFFSATKHTMATIAP